MVSRSIIPLARPYFPESLRNTVAADIEAILASGRLMLGPWTQKLEDRFADLTTRQHAISVNSCTTALHLALSFAGIKGKEVLVPAGSFITDVSVVKFAGGHPVLVDINRETLALDVEDLKRKVTANTRALIWVHLTGIIARDYREIVDFATKHDLFLIEDAAHAHSATIDGTPAGSFGDASTFSFYPTKIVTSGTGGMLTTDNVELANYAREVRIFGKQLGTGEIVHFGNDWFLDEIRACVAYHHASELESQAAHRRAIADRYRRGLANQIGLRLLDVPDGNTPAWYQYPVFLATGIDREALMDTLKATHGIETKGIYKPVHHEQIFEPLDDGTLKVTEETLLRSLCLPMHADMSEEDADFIAGVLVSEIRKTLR